MFLNLTHTEANFLLNSIDSLRLRVAQMPTSVIFVLTTMTTTQPIILLLAHARGVSNLNFLKFIGMSLSEPHINGISVRELYYIIMVRQSYEI